MPHKEHHTHTTLVWAKGGYSFPTETPSERHSVDCGPCFLHLTSGEDERVSCTAVLRSPGKAINSESRNLQGESSGRGSPAFLSACHSPPPAPSPQPLEPIPCSPELPLRAPASATPALLKRGQRLSDRYCEQVRGRRATEANWVLQPLDKTIFCPPHPPLQRWDPAFQGGVRPAQTLKAAAPAVGLGQVLGLCELC